MSQWRKAAEAAVQPIQIVECAERYLTHTGYPSVLNALPSEAETSVGKKVGRPRSGPSERYSLTILQVCVICRSACKLLRIVIVVVLQITACKELMPGVQQIIKLCNISILPHLDGSVKAIATAVDTVADFCGIGQWILAQHIERSLIGTNVQRIQSGCQILRSKRRNGIVRADVTYNPLP